MCGQYAKCNSSNRWKQTSAAWSMHALNEFASMITSIPGYGSSSHLSKQSTVMRNKLQQSRVHQLETIRTGLHHLCYYYLKEGKKRRGYSVKVIIQCLQKSSNSLGSRVYQNMRGVFTWSMYGLTSTCPTRASASRVLSMVAYVLRQWRTMSTLDVCRPSISTPSRDCCSMEVIPAIRCQRTQISIGKYSNGAYSSKHTDQVNQCEI